MRLITGLILSGLLSTSALAAPSQQDIAKEINLVTSAATAVVAGLQGKINDAKVAAGDVEAGALRTAFKEQFKKLGNSDFDSASDPALGAIRGALAKSFDAVMDKFRPDMIKGGQDAFVPAFFRAQLLDGFNKASQGKYQAIVTNRANELINRDLAPERVVADKAALEYVKGLLDKGEMEPQSKQVGDRLVTYWPMKIGEPCAVCHKRSGLDQKVGSFGGATVVVVEAQK